MRDENAIKPCNTLVSILNVARTSDAKGNIKHTIQQARSRNHAPVSNELHECLTNDTTDHSKLYDHLCCVDEKHDSEYA